MFPAFPNYDFGRELRFLKKSASLFTYISNAVCFLLLLVMLGTQCLPFWRCDNCKNHEGPKDVSIAEYTLVPKDHTPITKGMTSVYLDIYGQDLVDEKGKPFKFQANDTVIPCIIVIVACIISVIRLIKKPGSRWFPIFPFAAGLGGVIGYLTIAALEVGLNWQLHLVAAIILTLASGGTLLYYIIQYAKAKADAKKKKVQQQANL